MFWNLNQVQHKNPNVQIVELKNMTPSPFITCYLEDGKHRNLGLFHDVLSLIFDYRL